MALKKPGELADLRSLFFFMSSAREYLNLKILPVCRISVIYSLQRRPSSPKFGKPSPGSCHGLNLKIL